MICGRKQSGGLFSPTWQRAKRGDRHGSVGQNPSGGPRKSTSSEVLFQFYSPYGKLYCFAVLLCLAQCYSLREFIGE